MDDAYKTEQIGKPNEPPADGACVSCGATPKDRRLNDAKGCRFCKNMNPLHQSAISLGMGGLSDKYCLPLGDAYLGNGMWRDKDGREYSGERILGY